MTLRSTERFRREQIDLLHEVEGLPVIAHELPGLPVQDRIDVVENALVDFPYHALIDHELRVWSDLVHKRESLASREYLESVLLSRRGQMLEHILDLKVVQAVPFNASGPVNGPHPGAMPKPIPVTGVDPQVGEQPLKVFEVLEGYPCRSLGQPVLHQSGSLFHP